MREKDAQAEQWDGVRSGTRAAVDVFNADEVWRGSSKQWEQEDLLKVLKDWGH